MRPQTSFLLGEENDQGPRYVRINDHELINGAPAGSQRYVRGTAVDQAIEEGKLTDVSAAAMERRTGQVTKFKVTFKDGTTETYPSYAAARSVAITRDGSISVVQEDA